MSESTEAVQTTREAYAFACMSCGHGWERSYEIETRADIDGRPFVVYTVNGEQVPSPLTRPVCLNCDGHSVRLMRAGRVSDVARWQHPEGVRGVERTRHHSLRHFFHLGSGRQK